MDKVPPYFHFYPDAYWGDEKATLLSYEQHGLYLFLLSHQWREGSIPADLPTLAKLCRLDGDAMATLWRGLDRCFIPFKDRLINPRLDRERQKLITYFKSQSDRGKLGASATWVNKLKRRATPMAPPRQRQRQTDGAAKAVKRAYSSLSLKEVQEYFLEIKSTEEEAIKFYDHFQANGWKVGGKAPMRDWRAAVRNWVRRTPEFKGGSRGDEKKTPAGGVRGEPGKYSELMERARKESAL